eukprot:jgi/Bigna1/91513/estExt_fgenesh1_pg.C_1030048
MESKKERGGSELSDGPWILMTGGTGGIGAHLEEKLALRYKILSASRSASPGGIEERNSRIEYCRLLSLAINKLTYDYANSYIMPHNLALSKIPEKKIEWIVHLATTYNVKKDKAMVANLLRLAAERNIPNICFFSSWVVSFPSRLVMEPYLKMKGQCENLIKDFCNKNGKHYFIVRPSVVIGENLSWSRTLNRLWYVRQLIPRNMFRCWISIDHVAAAVDHHLKAVEEKRGESRVMQLLGERYMILTVVSWFSTYLNSFYIQHFRPTDIEEFLSFFNSYNNCLVSGAENMLLWHYTPPWIIEQKKILVTTRGLNKIHKITSETVVCDAGVPVHGHSHQFATVATLINSIKVFDIDTQKCKVLKKGTKEFKNLIFNTNNNTLVLQVDIQPCPLEEFVKTRKRLDFVTSTPDVLIKNAKFGDSCEVRMYVPVLDVFLGSMPGVLKKTPMIKGLLLTATVWNKRNKKGGGVVESSGSLDEKSLRPDSSDVSGKLEIEKVKVCDYVCVVTHVRRGDINWKRYVEKSTKFLWSLGSKLIMNTEWFFTEEEFIVFWKYYQKNWWRFGWYKILIRHCKADEFPHSPCYQRNVYAIDIVAFRYQRKFLADIMPKFSKTMHAGKFLCTDPDVIDKQDV